MSQPLDQTADERLQAILGSRPPRIALHIRERGPDGSVATEIRGGRSDEKVRLASAVERLFRDGASRLQPAEWDALLAREAPPVPDRRWVLLIRLAAEPLNQDEGGLRNQFVSLPDGTAFSMRLLFPEPRGKGERDVDPAALPFARLPAVAQLAVLRQAGTAEQQAGHFLKDAEFAGLLQQAAQSFGLRVGPVTGKNVSGLREKLAKKDAGHLLPNRKGRQERARAAVVPATEVPPAER